MGDRLPRRVRVLNQLSTWRETAFILCLAERAWPNVLLVSQLCELEWDLEDTLNRAWQSLEEREGEDQIVDQLDVVMAWMEELEAIDNYGSVQARGALELLEAGLISQINQDQSRAKAMFDLALGQITGHIEISEGDGLDDEDLVRLFDHHPLVKRHLKWLDECLRHIEQARAPGKQLVGTLRKLSDEGVSHIGIGLDELGDEDT